MHIKNQKQAARRAKGPAVKATHKQNVQTLEQREREAVYTLAQHKMDEENVTVDQTTVDSRVKTVSAITK